MSPTIPARNALNADSDYILSLLDSMTTLATRLRLLRTAKVHDLPVPASLVYFIRLHLSDLGEQFDRLASRPDVPLLELPEELPDSPVFASAAVARYPQEP